MAEQSGLQVRYEEIGKTVVVTPQGEIAYTEAPQLRQWIRKAQDTRPERIIVDLSGVGYMNTPGVATLVEALQIAKKNKYRLVLVGLNSSVRAVFEVARLHTVFEIVETRDAALK
ncbi:MAG: STAS domain-containing protein [Phycisphaerales bacterium]|nr:STAS domain-containing protein [Phycisphaerales bacterium]